MSIFEDKPSKHGMIFRGLLVIIGAATTVFGPVPLMKIINFSEDAPLLFRWFISLIGSCLLILVAALIIMGLWQLVSKLIEYIKTGEVE